MSLEAWLVFIPACFALNLSFGPNNLLALTNGARIGIATAVAASAGRVAAFAIMITVTALGLGALLAASELAFAAVKWIGAAYLVYLGVKLILGRAPVLEEGAAGQGRSLYDLARQDFLVAIGNPKAIVIFTAFLPQFVAADRPAQSFVILGATFLALEVAAVAIYAFSGRKLAGAIRRGPALRWFNRVSGSLLIGFGAALAASQRP